MHSQKRNEINKDLEIDSQEFDKTKIFEELEFRSKPDGYSKKLPWIVQLQIAATNGKQYQDIIGTLDDYPQYDLPVPKVEHGLMLDIGSGWGRWLVAGAKKGYIPVGIDLRLGFCKASLETLQAQGVKGYTVVADLQNIPFKESAFDLVWSFSVIQHTAETRLNRCLDEIHRVLNNGGFTYLEFPNKNGMRNRLGPAKQNKNKVDHINSWHVRYYSIEEYKAKLEQVFGNFSFDVHSFLGIGVLKEDLNYVSFKNKILCSASLIGNKMCRVLPVLKPFADSIYVNAIKKENKVPEGNNTPDESLLDIAGHRWSNLDIVPLLACPLSKGPLSLSPSSDFLISERAGVKYPVIDEIPILIASQAVAL